MNCLECTGPLTTATERWNEICRECTDQEPAASIDDHHEHYQPTTSQEPEPFALEEMRL